MDWRQAKAWANPEEARATIRAKSQKQNTKFANDSSKVAIKTGSAHDHNLAARAHMVAATAAELNGDLKSAAKHKEKSSMHAGFASGGAVDEYNRDEKGQFAPK